MRNNHQKRISTYFILVSVVSALLTLLLNSSDSESTLKNQTQIKVVDSDDELSATYRKLASNQTKQDSAIETKIISERPIKLIKLTQEDYSRTDVVDRIQGRKRRFLQRNTLESLETVPDVDGRFERTEIIKTQYHYPFLRADQAWKLDPMTGEKVLLAENLVVANHVIAQFESNTPEEKIAALIQELGYKLVKKIPATSTYLIDIGSYKMASLQEAKEALTNMGGAIMVGENRIYSN